MEHEEMIEMLEGLGYWVYREGSKNYNQVRLSELAEREGYRYDISIGLWNEV
ncbi:hypothetical protein [Carnobacterium maltaromaticum]|uniref:hypothetical protein n=1 Tax=Carnobacterium maltaromaticum TaxID=2751 RepID=UPI0012FCECEB|nr:hypothetical protein [Carnobacterium maltaromaticum]